MDAASVKILKEVGVWMRHNGEAVYGSHAWETPGESELVDGKLKKLPVGALNRRQAEFKYDAQDIRFKVGKNGAVYAFCMNLPTPGMQLKIKSFGTDAKYLKKPIKDVKLLGYNGKLKWKLEADGLAITCPEEIPFATSVVFKID